MQVLESSGRPASPADATANSEALSDRATPATDTVALLAHMDTWHRRACSAQRQFLSVVAEADRRSVWEHDGAHDMAHWVKMRYGVSDWRARRWIAAAHALESLPLTSEAFSTGKLGVDKVVELTRFATPETEHGLLGWAERVAAGTIRERGNELTRQSSRETRELESDRSFDWWTDPDGRQVQFEGRLPAAEARVVVNAVERTMRRLPVVPEEECPSPGQRRAGALVGICSARVASDPDPDRATVVVHVPVQVLWGKDLENWRSHLTSEAEDGEPGCGLEGGGVVPVEVARRLACDARIETVLVGNNGWVKGLGRSSRDPSPQMVRALRRRDGGCRFPGCGARAFTKAHHIRWWTRKGPIDMDNLVLLCSFHHKCVHELGWSLTLRPDNTVRFHRPDGTRYRAGPGPSA